jgi:hypothetical protein
MVKLDVMEQNETIQKYLPPRVIESITSGVNRIEKQPYLLLFPILYDLLLWLGPNFSIRQLVMSLYSNFLSNAEAIYQFADIDIQPLYDLQVVLSDFLSGYNLLSVLRTFPIGIPGLMVNSDTSFSPIGTTSFFTISGVGSFLLFTAIIMMVGLILGTMYIRILTPKSDKFKQTTFIQQFSNSFIYSILLLIIVSISIIASLFLSSFIAILFPLLGQFLFLIILSSLFFLLLPGFYAFIPIFLYGQSFYQAIIISYKVVGLRLRLKINSDTTVFISPKIVPFTMFIFVMYQGLNIIWRLPSPDTWWMLIGIFGHSFIATLILHACFDFFQRMCVWHQRLTHSDIC